LPRTDREKSIEVFALILLVAAWMPSEALIFLELLLLDALVAVLFLELLLVELRFLAERCTAMNESCHGRQGVSTGMSGTDT
jgi:Na+/pantothenate symporter